MPPTDEEMDRIISNVLRAGVSIAGLVVFSGAIVYLLGQARSHPNFSVFRGEPADLRSVSGVLGDLAHWNPRSWMEFGILLLIATPIARVIFCVFAFGAQRDWTYVAISVIVLAILLYSLWGGGI